jgi:Kef-type K+ transport system membrane component KefB
MILLAAKLGGDVMVRLGQPEVLGELCVGIVLGNLPLLGIESFSFVSSDEVLTILSELGVILLLFEVGHVPPCRDAHGWGLGAARRRARRPHSLLSRLGSWRVFAPNADTLVHVYLGATLTATSVGITARVLASGTRDQQRSKNHPRRRSHR